MIPDTHKVGRSSLPAAEGVLFDFSVRMGYNVARLPHGHKVCVCVLGVPFVRPYILIGQRKGQEKVGKHKISHQAHPQLGAPAQNQPGPPVAGADLHQKDTQADPGWTTG